MSPDTPSDALCREVERKLSAFIDAELGELEHLRTESHLALCSSCRRELELLVGASGFLREAGRRVPEAPSWESVRKTIARSRPPRSIWTGSLGRGRAIAASLTLVALAAVVFALARVEWSQGPKTAAAGADQPYLQLAGLPGLQGFLEDHQAQEVETASLPGRLGFVPQVPEELPGGYRLERAYVVQDQCCAGSCLVYRKGSELVTLVQHPPSHPVSWRSGDLENCTVAGRACRRARSREVELLQIEPEGRNLTVVARAGIIDPTVFVRALSGD